MWYTIPVMFCPECRAEFRPGFTRCADCDVPLVDRLPARRDDPDERVTAVALLKSLGPIIAIPIVAVALLILLITLEGNPFQIQIVTLLAQTGFVLLLVFCDTRSWVGYRLGDKAVRQKLPLLLCLHAGFLALVFGGATGAFLLRPHLPDFWTLERDRNGTSYFDLVLLFTGFAVVFSQVFLFRGILGRAVKAEQNRGGS